jgi:hypothetical protein
LSHFWLSTAPALDGHVRAAFYALLLATALWAPRVRPPLGDSPLQAPELFAAAPPGWASQRGITRWIPSRHAPAVLRWLRRFAIACWVCCIVGFGGSWTVVGTAVCFVALQSVSAGLIGVSHRWYVPMYSLAALSFANGNRNFSVDAAISRAVAGYFRVRLSCRVAGLDREIVSQLFAGVGGSSRDVAPSVPAPTPEAATAG